MSTQKLDPDVRHSVWMAHGKKCVYCSEPLSFAEVDIDHVIPERLSGTQELQATLSELSLDSDFDILDVENFLPSHRRCNLSKKGDAFKPAAARFYLQLSIAAADKVRSLISGKRSQNQKDFVLETVSDAIRSGMISTIDLEVTPDPNILHLSKPILFADAPEEPVYTVSVEDIDQLLDRPVLVGGNPVFTTDFGDASGVRMVVRTCREYRAALAANFYPLTTFDIRSEAFLKTVNSVLTAASTLSRAKVSFIQNPHKGVADLDLLPISMLDNISPDDREFIETHKDLSVQDLLTKGDVKILRISSTELSLEWSNMGFLFREICRADVDGDGIEDILCRCCIRAIGGTFGAGYMCTLSRPSQDAQFSQHSL